ncbi:TetR/AcrR family transcriptional regulator [Streptomyces sp. NBC_00335]|uniref:TetR/AcrR family transcriptional regulator n=1 Tax=unclassified Streptomyces TaxID=2593676 RepID=UPI0022589560|nr:MULTISPECIES: TetR/AcrR family transcriptional regulator [unclassified Streptomyces]MCX5409760.1 TetR/AcrR family transcriptional regulator [Streptomyces sp. NBC_00086]
MTHAPSDVAHKTRRLVPEAEILRAALTAFSRHGFEGVSLRSLNADLNVSHNMLTKRYGSKEALWKAAVDDACARLTRALDRVEDPASSAFDRLHGMIVTFVEAAAHQPDLLRLVNSETTHDSERVTHLWTRHIEPTINRFAPLYAQLVEDGTLKGVPLPTVYFMITAGGTAPWANPALSARLGHPPDSAAAVRSHAHHVADLILGGLRTPR